MIDDMAVSKLTDHISEEGLIFLVVKDTGVGIKHEELGN
jgi:hypothetical protein